MEANRRGKDAQNSLTPHPLVKLGEISWLRRSPVKSEGLQPHIRPPSSGFQCQEEKAP